MKLILGDCIEQLKTLEPNSVDSVVTDPPYGLAFMGKKWDYDVPSVELWREVLRVLKPGGHLLSFGGTRTYHRMVVAIEDAGVEIRDQVQWIYGSGFPKSLNLKDEWQGFGTALKPANEPIVLARKPLEKGLTVAQNVLKWGCGGLNIDGCRIDYANAADKKLGQSARPSKTSNANEYAIHHGGLEGFDRSNRSEVQGRWPANVLFDESAAEMLDGQTKDLHGAGSKRTGGQSKQNQDGGLFGVGQHDGNGMRFGDSGGASRFFYVAKASKRERGEGNGHPTVKPIKLMEYLCKLITPPNGTIIDPFMGSGTTGIAAKNLGFNFIGIEREPEYFEIAKRRADAVILTKNKEL